MTVMTAGVHEALTRGAMGEGVGFLDRKRVHVGPERDGARARAAPQRADNASAGESTRHIEAK
ncbi:MAG: hypothetical protein BroJett013_29540 [Alphaproteobacteria bacterium]|nr:MAG: hypothetical protein BroJett013_29540 [Alphaproteobacteria bacterium]